MSDGWEMRLYRRSIKKKETMGAVLRLLPELGGKRCLELGCAGAPRSLLRERGGRWACADVEPERLEESRRLLGEDAYLIEGGKLPFPGDTFDVAVAINFIRHLTDDLGFVREIGRVLKPGGCLVFTCPEGATNRKGFRLKRLLRLTNDTGGFDEVREGYRRLEVEKLVRDAGLELGRLETYSRIFTEAVESSLQFAYHFAVSRAASTGADLPADTWPVTNRHFESMGWKFRAYELAYPLLRGVSLLDHLIVHKKGYMFCVRAVKRSTEQAPGGNELKPV